MRINQIYNNSNGRLDIYNTIKTCLINIRYAFEESCLYVCNILSICFLDSQNLLKIIFSLKQLKRVSVQHKFFFSATNLKELKWGSVQHTL